jgi:hypothetical protein
VLVVTLDLAQRRIADGGSVEVDEALFDLGAGVIRAPYETLPFLLHGLRLSGVPPLLQEFAKSLLDSRRRHDFAKYLSDCREALNEDWRDRDIFAKFRSKGEDEVPNA